MSTQTITPVAERVERYARHAARYWTALEAAEEQADLDRIVTDNALCALMEGNTAESAVWCSLGELRAALRQRAWR